MNNNNFVEVRLNPNELNMVVYRYMDYPKFLSMITTNSLYFAKPEEFEDKIDSIFPEYSGIKNDDRFLGIIYDASSDIAKECFNTLIDCLNKTYIQNNPNREQVFIVFQQFFLSMIFKRKNNLKNISIERINKRIWDIVNAYIANNESESINLLHNFLFELLQTNIIDTRIINRKRALINCWHIGEYESDLMWKTYAKKDGIMIQTNIDKLKKLDYKKYLDEEASCVIDKVKYIDLIERNEEKNSIKFGMSSKNENADILCHYFEKNKSFKDENELRIVIAKNQKYINNYINEEQGENVKITIPISKFIDKIIISPFAPNYYISTLQDVLNKMKLTSLVKKIELSKAKFVENKILSNFSK